MNTGENTSFADNQQVSKKISDDYFVGFVDGEGCFYVGFSKRKDLPMKWQIITEFHLSQNPGSRVVLEAFRDRLGCGYLKPNHAKSTNDKTWILIVKDRHDLTNKLIPFFDKHQLQTTKRYDFLIFKVVLDLIQKKQHLTRQGFEKIVDIVFSNKRKTKKKYLKVSLLS
jgi:hypothetical protein